MTTTPTSSLRIPLQRSWTRIEGAGICNWHMITKQNRMGKAVCAVLLLMFMMRSSGDHQFLVSLLQQREREIKSLRVATFGALLNDTVSSFSTDEELRALLLQQGEVLQKLKISYVQLQESRHATSSSSSSSSSSICASLNLTTAALEPRVLPNPTRWLHIPKCGMSLKNVIIHSACPGVPKTALFGSGLNSPFNLSQLCTTRLLGRIGHRPLSSVERLQPERVVALFRRPNQRIISAFYANRHSIGSGFDRNAARLVSSVGSRGEAKLVAFLNTTLPQYAHFPGIAGCATRMILGDGCAGEPSKPNRSMAVQAAALLRRFAFIGLTERYAESICLWHATFGGEPLPVEFADVHVGEKHPVQQPPERRRELMSLIESLSFDAEALQSYNESLLGKGFFDANDEFTYAAAEGEFKRRMAAALKKKPSWTT